MAKQISNINQNVETDSNVIMSGDESFETDNLDGLREDFDNALNDSDSENEPPTLEMDQESMTDGVPGGRAFPDSMDGTSRDFVSKTAADERAESEIERPMQSKLNSGNVDDIVRECSDAITTIKQYELDRTETNAEISAVREKLEALGIPKKSLAIAIAVSKMSEDQMDGFYLALHLLLKAIDREPKQIDMFLNLMTSNHSPTDETDD